MARTKKVIKKVRDRYLLIDNKETSLRYRGKIFDTIDNRQLIIDSDTKESIDLIIYLLNKHQNSKE